MMMIEDAYNVNVLGNIRYDEDILYARISIGGCNDISDGLRYLCRDLRVRLLICRYR